MCVCVGVWVCVYMYPSQAETTPSAVLMLTLHPPSGTLKSPQSVLSWSCPDAVLFSPVSPPGSLLHSLWPPAPAPTHDPQQRDQSLPHIQTACPILSHGWLTCPASWKAQKSQLKVNQAPSRELPKPAPHSLPLPLAPRSPATALQSHFAPSNAFFTLLPG